jgi:hypothetical protein
MNLDEVDLCGDSRARSKGQDRQGGGATLKIEPCLGLEKASCGVELRRASLQGFESPSPHHFTGSLPPGVGSLVWKNMLKPPPASLRSIKIGTPIKEPNRSSQSDITERAP